MPIGDFRFDAYVDFRVLVVVFAFVHDLAPVSREVEVPRVLDVVAAVAETRGVGLLGLEGNEFAELGIVGFG